MDSRSYFNIQYSIFYIPDGNPFRLISLWILEGSNVDRIPRLVLAYQGNHWVTSKNGSCSYAYSIGMIELDLSRIG